MKFIKTAWVLLAIVGLVAWFGVTCAKAGDTPCWDCLTRGGDWNATKVKGDIITCQPAGWKWGKAEIDGYKVVRVCCSPEEATALASPIRDKDGKPGPWRFSALVVDDKPVICDKVSSCAVLPADAKALVEADAKELEPVK